jgi:glycosyltransferase involved in cell wall biosynthesis
MTTMPLSVIMPVKDGGRYLEKALTSTLRAMPSESELLVLNDGSADNSGTVLESVNDSRLKVYTRKSSRGVASALNLLLENVRYPVVARMDADDICMPWRFSVQERIIARQGGIVFGNVVYCNDKGVPIRPTLRIPASSNEYRRQLLDRNPFVHPTLLAETAIIEKVGGYQIVGAEDYDLWLRLAALRVPFAVSLSPVLFYRQHGAQVTSSHEARESLRRRWFAEEALVKSWVNFADRELGLSLAEEYSDGNADSIDDLRKSATFLQATRGTRF